MNLSIEQGEHSTGWAVVNDEGKPVRRSCGNCINMKKLHEGTKHEIWVCQEYAYLHNESVDTKPAPVNCTPPSDRPCEMWKACCSI